MPNVHYLAMINKGQLRFFFSVILHGSFHRHWEHRMAWLGFGCYWSCELLAKGWQWVWKKAFFLCLCLKYATVICYEHADAHFLCPCCDCVCMEKRSRFLLFFTVIHVCWTRERERACIDGMVSARIWHAGKAKLSRNISERCIILYHRGGTALLLIQSLWKIYIYNCIY